MCTLARSHYVLWSLVLHNSASNVPNARYGLLDFYPVVNSQLFLVSDTAKHNPSTAMSSQFKSIKVKSISDLPNCELLPLGSAFVNVNTFV